MIIYCILLALILLLYAASGKKNMAALRFVFVCIFFVAALRAPSVGRDLPGYIRIYDMTRNIPFWNFNYVYYEAGYILFMKLCALLGLSNQMFIAVTAFITIAPIYLFVKKYSNNYMLSALIYICYMLFEFDLTGIRQAMSMSICLLALIVFSERQHLWLLKFVLISIVAVSLHTGAVAVICALPILCFRSTKSAFAVTAVLSIGIVALRGAVMAVIKDLFNKTGMNTAAGLQLGNNLLFTMGCVLVVAFVCIKAERGIYRVNEESYIWLMNYSKLFFMSIPLYFLFGSETSVRSVMYLTQLLMVLLPECFAMFTKQSRRLASIVCSMFFVAFFTANTLLANNFDIIPYRFFWQ